MEIGTKVTWTPEFGKTMIGLFMQEENDIAEVMCIQMGNINCRLKVFVDMHLIKEVQ